MQIEGIYAEQFEHKIMLYADDLVFLLRNPVSSLIVKKLLSEYGRVSGFSMNQSKSPIMGMNITASLRN